MEIANFEAKKGEKVFLQGASGSGKSTLLNLIGGVLVPESGSLEVLGQNLGSLSAGARDQFRGDHMGFIFQMFNLLPYFSAEENVLLPCRFSKLKMQRVLESSDTLNEEASRLFSKLDLKADALNRSNITQLSVGQQQRVAAVRALMGKPEIIIADEPTSALDADIRDRFLDLLFGECEKFQATLIFVSHDQSLGEKFDRTVFLSEINKASRSLESSGSGIG
ncbi:MAG: ABC transporter ATP-binding protein [Pseudomonadota bacterium]